jgi:hypothetical protein
MLGEAKEYIFISPWSSYKENRETWIILNPTGLIKLVDLAFRMHDYGSLFVK